MDETTSLSGLGLGWLDASGPHAEIVLSTRVRLARNLQGQAFGSRARVNDREAVLKAVTGVQSRLESMADSRLLSLRKMAPRGRKILLERRLVSPDLLGREEEEPPYGAALLVSETEPLSLMVNEEDHLRLQGLLSGLRFMESWNIVDQLDDEIGEHLPLAYHHEFGFLTSCPTNVGTGLRASALVHLPGLVLTKEIKKVLQSLSQFGLTFRGLYGEGSEVMGNFFQISNQTTLGKSEEDLVEHLDQIVSTVIQKELQARHVLMRDAAAVTEDKVWRAYGLLRYARRLSYEELMNLLSGVRLGVSLKLLTDLSVYTLNKLMIFSQAGHLEEAAGQELSTAESDTHRAEYLRRVLATEGQADDKRDDEG